VKGEDIYKSTPTINFPKLSKMGSDTHTQKKNAIDCKGTIYLYRLLPGFFRDNLFSQTVFP